MYERVSKFTSWIFLLLILIYLFIKTLILPVYTELDIALANLVPDELSASWLDIVAAGGASYLPEARADLLFELGLHFPKE